MIEANPVHRFIRSQSIKTKRTQASCMPHARGLMLMTRHYGTVTRTIKQSTLDICTKKVVGYEVMYTSCVCVCAQL